MEKKKNIILVINFIMLASLICSSFISYFIAVKSARNEIVKKQLPITSDNVYTEIQNDILKPIIISSLMANDTFLRDWVISGEKNEMEIRKYLKSVQEKYNVFTSFFVSEQTKTYYHSEGILKKVNINSERDKWYFRVREMEENYEINIDPDMANRDYLTIFINYKVYDYKGNFIGATGVGLKVDTLKYFLEGYQNKYSSKIYFINKDGEIKLSNFEVNEKNINIKNIAGIKNIAEKILNSNSKEIFYKKNGVTILVNSRYIPELKWFLVVEQSDEEFVKKMIIALLINLTICLIITVLVSVVFYILITNHQNELEKMTLTDRLTNVYNKYAFNLFINESIKDCKRTGDIFTLIIFDIDNFKKINDSYGHIVGDKVIKKVAEIVKENIRESDCLFRWGGDEFIVLLRKCDFYNGVLIAEKIRGKVSDIKFNEENKEFSITISLGIAEHKKDEKEEETLKRADDALYKAKSSGKNKVEVNFKEK